MLSAAASRSPAELSADPQHLDRRLVAVLSQHLFVRPDLLETGLDLQTCLVDEGAGALLADHRTLVLEPAERVTDRRTADSEIGREIVLCGDAPILELTPEDALLEVMLDLIGQRWAAGDHLRGGPSWTASQSCDHIV